MDKGKLVRIIIHVIRATAYVLAAEHVLPPEYAPLHAVLMLLGGGQ